MDCPKFGDYPKCISEPSGYSAQAPETVRTTSYDNVTSRILVFIKIFCILSFGPIIPQFPAHDNINLGGYLYIIGGEIAKMKIK